MSAVIINLADRRNGGARRRIAGQGAADEGFEKRDPATGEIMTETVRNAPRLVHPEDQPGWAVHIWLTPLGLYGVETACGHVDPDFPPEGAPLVEGQEEALDLALSIGERTGFPVISHVGGW